MYKIVEKTETAPNTSLVKVSAPQVAAKAQPGQFIVVMVDERSERIPYTLSDWSKEDGTVTFVVNEVGRSTGKLVSCSEGDALYSVVGPLGIPPRIDKVGTIVCAGGCFGIAAILPLARAFKKAGNRVISVIEARAHYLLYLENELRKASDELVIATGDGSRGIRGFAPDAIKSLLEGREGRRGDSRIALYDQVIAIGCTFMLKLVCEATRPFGVKTLVDLCPIIVDATGMCGCCRVQVGGETKFACVDGPFFDGHAVDWDVLGFRAAAYVRQEMDSVQSSKVGVRR
ncbi:MAG: sulfide/dihydroorotate dehydrogenase-like FAD/NAD-binding protein [Candidatus Coatesbacteria bacterium]|nr:sulfide/dihydroorotate dehydrogenase-like FAD/NAD-binding protein [Candidatus Coatesbacteria bacterium]